MRILLCFLLLISVDILAQDPRRFKEEVQDLKSGDSLVNSKKLNLFAGSSSIRMWTDMATRFSGYNVLNRGFGGSQMSELFYYSWELIVDYRPSRIFIYEGDNDIGEGKATEEILSDADKLLKVIRAELGRKVKVVFITPKPSIRRWDMRPQFETFIASLKKWAASRKNVAVIDVWSAMLDEKGDLRRDLFLDDGLHMNAKGYDIWEREIRPYLVKR